MINYNGADLEELREAIEEEIRTSPVCHHAANIARTEREAGIEADLSPTEAVSSQLAMAWIASLSNSHPLFREENSEPLVKRLWWPNLGPEARRFVSLALLKAEPFLWDQDIFMAAATMELPEHTIKLDQKWTSKPAYWQFNTRPSIVAWRDGPTGEVAVLEGVLLIPTTIDAKTSLSCSQLKPNELGALMSELLSIFKEKGDTKVLVYYQIGAKRKTTLPHIVSGGVIVDGETYYAEGPKHNIQTSQVLAAMAFLDSVVAVASQKLPRAVRRASKRIGHRQPPLVKVVKLRRKHVDQAKRDLPLSDTGRSYTHRWLVSGHFRNQWYPSQQTHKLIYVNPYLKGPEDGELLPGRPTIAAVKR